MFNFYLLPCPADNKYRGNKIALWFFIAFVWFSYFSWELFHFSYFWLFFQKFVLQISAIAVSGL